MFALEKQIEKEKNKENGEEVFCYLSFWRHGVYILSVYCT